MKPAEECLRLEGLRIERGQSLILENVDWVVRKGEHWVLLGANGSGKTSLLRALAGYFMPTAGKIFLLGKQYDADVDAAKEAVSWFGECQ